MLTLPVNAETVLPTGNKAALELFKGTSGHHGYDHQRMLADMVPVATLRMTPQQAGAAYPGRWRDLVGADHATGH